MTTVQAVPKLDDVIIWLMGRVEKFPRSQKFTLGDRIVNISLDTLDILIEATYTQKRLPLLQKVNVQLEKLRFLIRICHDFKLISAKQYTYISNEINEVGKLVGGWIRKPVQVIMKTHNRLFQKICSFENLFNAARKAQRSKRFQAEVARFNFHLEKGLYSFVKEDLKCPYYIRYVDDFVVLERDKARLHQVKAEMEGYLARFRLKLHLDKCQVFPVKDGTDFLGYQVFPTHRRLRASSVRRARRRLHRLGKNYERGEISWQDVNHSVQSWLGHVKHADTYGLRRVIFSQTIFRRS